MTSEETLELAHREAWRYKKSSDPHHSDTYTFNRSTLLEFARKLTIAEREQCAKTCEALELVFECQSAQPGYWPDQIAHKCAIAIRERSNAGIHRAAEGRPVE